MKLSLGPIQYYWSRDDVMAFYDEIARSRVDIVYLGEVVCSKRHLMRFSDWLEVARMLRAHGKEAVLSTLAMPETEADLRRMRTLTESDEFPLEVNDMSALGLVARRKPFVAGPHLNCYSAPVLDWLAQLGASRWVVPIECTRDTLDAIHRQRTSASEIECLVLGHAPLSFSARCFTARHHQLQKDQCEHRCADYVSGLDVSTLDGHPFIRLNGVQTQTAQMVNLVRAVDGMVAAGVSILRVSPQFEHTAAILDTLADQLDGTLTPDAAYHALCELQDAAPCDGFWFGEPGVVTHCDTGE